MKLIGNTILLTTLILSGGLMIEIQAQSMGSSINSKVGVYVYPAKGQDTDQQNKDESDCYTWAVQQSGIDPLNPPKVEAQQVSKGPTGGAVRGAAGGAIRGAAIGAIAGDGGKGAKIGAAGGAMVGHRAGRVGRSMEQAGNDQAAAQQSADNMNSFKKAYKTCLQGKGYTVN